MAIYTPLLSVTRTAILLAVSAPAVAATQDSRHIGVVFDELAPDAFAALRVKCADRSGM